MSLETLISGLTRDEQIVAMELLWKRLTTEDPAAAPPEWHRSVVAERVAAIERGEEGLSDWADASWDDVMYRLYVRQKIEAGLEDVEQGRTLSVSEVRKRFGLPE